MKKKIREIFKYRVHNLAFLAAVVLVFGGWLWAFIALKDVKQDIIINFESLEEINGVGSFADLSKVGFFGLIVTLINFLIATELEKRDRFWGRFTAGAMVFVGALIFIYFVAIILVN
ncbi:MAG: hypothetical protein WCX12_02300 [Candidatus Paceibacterota bacterium]|jgi:hypothetical protein